MTTNRGRPFHSHVAACIATTVVAALLFGSCGTSEGGSRSGTGGALDGGSGAGGKGGGAGSAGTATAGGAGTGGAEGGAMCGGFVGLTCGDGQWCDYDGDACGNADASGTCRSKPTNCPLDCPGVCGCDGNFYCNTCLANAAGTDTTTDRSCIGDGGNGAPCTTDAQCGSGLRCCYPCGIPDCSYVCTPPDPSGGCPKVQ
jgi:hypothetical protein